MADSPAPQSGYFDTKDLRVHFHNASTEWITHAFKQNSAADAVRTTGQDTDGFL